MSHQDSIVVRLMIYFTPVRVYPQPLAHALQPTLPAPGSLAQPRNLEHQDAPELNTDHAPTYLY